MRTCAYEASALAASADIPSDVLQALERSFRWTDPAAPLLLSLRHVPGTTILESPYPCSVPHIVIHDPAPWDEANEPYARWLNTVPDVQDAAFGQRLVLPFNRMFPAAVINLPWSDVDVEKMDEEDEVPDLDDAMSSSVSSSGEDWCPSLDVFAWDDDPIDELSSTKSWETLSGWREECAEFSPVLNGF